MDGISADHRVEPDDVRVGQLIPHREKERAVAWNGRCLPYGGGVLQRIRLEAEIATSIPLPEDLIRRVHASCAPVVEDHVFPAQRIRARRRYRVSIDDVAAYFIDAGLERPGSHRSIGR